MARRWSALARPNQSLAHSSGDAACLGCVRSFFPRFRDPRALVYVAETRQLALAPDRCAVHAGVFAGSRHRGTSLWIADQMAGSPKFHLDLYRGRNSEV